MENIPQISKDQFYLWKNSPVTQTVFKYLEVYSNAQKTAHLERWMSGEAITDSDFEVKARGVLLFIQQFQELDYDELAKTFEWGEQSEDDK